MLGDLTPGLPEHQITPILKLIDFGVWPQAQAYNLYESFVSLLRGQGDGILFQLTDVAIQQLQRSE
jgi:hypothetical protein